MTSESGVEHTAAEEISKELGELGNEIAELIKQRDDARDHVHLLERTVVQMSSLLAEAEVEKLEAKLELAKVRAAEARRATREDGVKGIAVYALRVGKDEPNGKDA